MINSGIIVVLHEQINIDIRRIRLQIESFSIKAIQAALNLARDWKEEKRVLVYTSSELAMGVFVKRRQGMGISIVDINSRYFMCISHDKFIKNKKYHNQIIIFKRSRGLETTEHFEDCAKKVLEANKKYSPENFVCEVKYEMVN